LLPLRLLVAARSVRGRLRLLGDASNGTSPLPFAASSKTQRSRRHSHVHSRMREKHSKRIPPRITPGAQLQECGNRFLGVPVSSLRVSPENFSGLSLYVIGELLDELLEILRHTGPYIVDCQQTELALPITDPRTRGSRATHGSTDWGNGGAVRTTE
jgi:hypothetical protein